MQDVGQTASVVSAVQAAEQAQDNPFQEIFGRAPLTLVELIKKLDAAYWPAEVVVSAPDFIALSTMMAGPPQREEATQRAYFWIANTKVLCYAPKPGLLDLTKYDGPSRVVIPKVVFEKVAK